ncbi:uncharacterized protein LOC104357765 [Tyto alba]|uniref:uncharacterized protein LOC104357765 n=1 Tax=Tyto alba TaxID=56313 RepID=UPI001C6737FB|nr:uncharacterized protein LOC104357765 [Tyto alba]
MELSEEKDCRDGCGGCTASINFCDCCTCAGAIGWEDEQGNLFAERGCCRRERHFLHVGNDVSGSPVSVDVGKCWSSCLTGWISCAPPGLLGLSRHSSTLEFLRSKSGAWGGTRTALASAVQLTLQVRRPDLPLRPAAPSLPCRFLLQACPSAPGAAPGGGGGRWLSLQHCSTCPEECLCLPALKTFFPDSPWEATADVGKCSAPTYTDGLFCVPTKFNTVLVKNPQGGEVVRTPENCQMKEKCYRVSQVEYYYEIVHSSAGRREEQLEEIDVGRCLGSCSSGDPCLLREL